LTVTTEAPRVFLSHASEDKESFVLPFAEALMSRGLHIWLDHWEMLPGDSLVDKIFSEGLGGAAAIIVVLSKVSITKPWVAEELDAAVVKRIQDNTKLIPVVLDDLKSNELPVAIRHLLFEEVPDRTDFDVAVDRVVRAVFGTSDKPPVGPAPFFATLPAPQVSGLDRIDILVLKAMGDEAVGDFGDHFHTETFLAAVQESLSITQEQAVEALEVLDADHYVRINRTIGRGLPSMANFSLTWRGLESYATTFVDGYDRLKQTVISRLAAWPSDQGNDEELANQANVPRLLVRHILRGLKNRGLIGLSEPSGPWVHFYSISPKLRRLI
jgi:hypothetical protein